MPGEDALRDELENNPSSNQGSGDSSDNPNSNTPDTKAIWEKTFEKNTYFFYNDEDNELEKKLKERAEKGKKRGVDDLPENLNGNKFPIALVKPTQDSLGDWQQNLPPKYGPYPNIDAKSGFTKNPVYSEEISKLNFNSDNLKIEEQPAIERIKTRKQYYNNFNDFAGKQFLHLLDYFSDQKGIGVMRPIPADTYSDGTTIAANTKDIYLGSFIKTFDDNEDPTYLGYDLKIKQLDSPLFNGSIENFIQQFSGYGNSEIGARLELLSKFKEQFYKFLRTDLETTTPKFNGGDGVKTYYLRKIVGLDKLVESLDSNESKQFVDYGKDFITLSFNEDVTQNIGYLASLYKALSYSRINGKLIVPENVLRFDVEIEITEVRKFNRVVQNVQEKKLDFIADKISKYIYTLYECQLFFTSLPHGESLDMSNIAEVSEYEIKFNYKFSTLKFTKLTYDSGFGDDAVFSEYNINNRLLNPTKVQSNETNNANIEDGSIEAKEKKEKAKSTGGVDTETGKKTDPEKEKSELDGTKDAAKKEGTEGKEPDAAVTDTTNKQIEVKPNFGQSFADLIKKSQVEKAITDRLSQIVPSKDKKNERLEEVEQEAISPKANGSGKGFAQGIIGGILAGAAGSINKNTSGSDKKIKNDSLQESKNKIINENTISIARNLFTQASLLNKTLRNINEGKNPVQSQAKTKSDKDKNLEKTKNFVGKALKSFFTK